MITERQEKIILVEEGPGEFSSILVHRQSASAIKQLNTLFDKELRCLVLVEPHNSSKLYLQDKNIVLKGERRFKEIIMGRRDINK